MKTAEEIQEILKEKKAAGKLLKKYVDAKKHIAAMEKHRQSLLGVIGATPGKYEWDDYERYRKRMAEITVPKEDGILLEEYIDGLEIIDIIEVAVRDRMNTRRKNAAEDMFLNNFSTGEIIRKYDVCERTVRNIKKKGMIEIEKEMALRIGSGRTLSSQIF